MNKPVTIDGIAERLSTIVETHENPKISAQAKRLSIRLRSPVRVVFLGFPGTGKLDIVNAILEGLRLPAAAADVTVELRYGAKDAIEVTRSDGTVVRRDGPVEPTDFTDAAFVIVERPAKVLRQVSLLNVVADVDADEQHAAISWSASRTDIALWVSHRFGPYDREIWSRVPEGVKDHAFLVLTGCDADQASDVKARYHDEFVDVYSIDIASTGQNASETGVGDLADRIAYHAQLGRRADLDSAMLFLKAHEAPVAGPKAAPPKPAPKPEPAVEDAKEAAEPPEAIVDDASNLAAIPSDLFEQSVTIVRERGEALLAGLHEQDSIDASAFVGQCRETLTQLGDVIADHDEAGQASVAWLGDAVMEAESLVILLESEKGDEAAIDAVSILLQVRRDLEMRQAA